MIVIDDISIGEESCDESSLDWSVGDCTMSAPILILSLLFFCWKCILNIFFGKMNLLSTFLNWGKRSIRWSLKSKSFTKQWDKVKEVELEIQNIALYLNYFQRSKSIRDLIYWQCSSLLVKWQPTLLLVESQQQQ